MEGREEARLKRVRLVKTCLLPMAYLAIGLIAGVQGPTLLDLSQLLHCSVESLSTAIMFFPVGILLGSVTGAVLTDRFTELTDLVLAGLCISMGLCIGAVPWAPALWIVALLNFVGGIGQGNLNVACSSLTMSSWGDKAASPIHALHAFFSVGKLLGAPLTGPFLSAASENSTNRTDDTIMSPLYGSNMLELTHADSSHDLHYHSGANTTMIYVPYAVVGGVLVLVGVGFAVFHCLGWTFAKLVHLGIPVTDSINVSAEGNIQHSSEPSPSNIPIGEESKPLKWFFLITLFLVYVSIACRDSINSIFLFAIGVTSHLNMAKSLATVMLTTYFASAAVSRLLAIVYAHWVDIHLLLFFQLTSCLLFCSLMATLALDSVFNLWLLSNLLSFMAAPTYPTIMAWSNHYQAPSGVVVAVIDLGIGAGNFSAIWLGGFLFDHFGGSYIFYLSLGFAVFMVGILIILQLCALVCIRRRTNRREHPPDSNAEALHADERTPLIN